MMKVSASASSQIGAIRIGAAAALSGTRTAQTPQFYHGVSLAVQDWNKKHDQQVTVAWGNDQANADLAPKIARQVCAQEVLGIVGHFSSGCAIQAAPVYGEQRIPLLLPASTHPDAAREEHVFRLCGRDDVIGQQTAFWVLQYFQPEKVLVAHDGSLYGQYIAREITSVLRGQEKKVFEHQWRNHEEEATFLKHVFSPNVALFMGRSHDAAQFASKYHYIQPTVPLVFGDDIINQEFIDQTHAHLWSVGLPSLEQHASLQRFAEMFYKKAQEKATYFAATTYASVQILLQAIQAAYRHPASRGSNGEQCFERTDRDLISIIQTGTWETILGKVAFDENGERRGCPIAVWQLTAGQFQWVCDLNAENTLEKGEMSK